MKTTLIFVFALAAMPLLADDKPAATLSAAATTAPQPKVLQAPDTGAATTDSPLVAAAKKSKAKRATSKSTVITQETLSKIGSEAHVTTTSNGRTLNMPAPAQELRPTPEMIAADDRLREKRAQEKKDAAAKVEADRKQRRLEAAAAAAEGFLDTGGDPAAAEQSAEREQKPAETKPPQQ
ncbi:MAG TPA: hypothetical protein VFN10_00230 [Thermoanaerobaculia bacterium]|nr:hypothetical protein [Thermoanaerobaculia bacterium]